MAAVTPIAFSAIVSDLRIGDLHDQSVTCRISSRATPAPVVRYAIWASIRGRCAYTAMGASPTSDKTKR